MMRTFFVVIDEASWMLKSATSRGFIDKALRTFRKYNGAIILATQSLAEIETSEIMSLLLESTAIKIFLPNRTAVSERGRRPYEMLGLKPREIDIIGSPDFPLQKAYLVSTEYGSRVMTPDLGLFAAALCASTGAADVARARHVLEQYGAEAFCEAWLAACGLAPFPASATTATTPSEVAHSNGRIHANA
jgi:type IV secretory pathway VirB4 component